MSRTWNEKELQLASEQMKKMGHLTYEEFCEKWDVNLITTAKGYLEEQMKQFSKTMAPDMKSALSLAISCMNKRLPAKAEKTDSGHFYTCPSCNKIISKNEQSHGNLNIPCCKWCGQVLDWRD